MSKNRNQYTSYSAGISMVELLVAMGIFLIVVVTGLTTIIHSFNVNTLSGDEVEATLLAQQGIEAVTSVRNQDWANITAGSYQVDATGGSWVLNAGSQTIGSFTRNITIESVQRNGSDQIVNSGGTVDPDTYKVTSEVAWNPSPTRNNSVSLVTYLTNWTKAIFTVGSWTAPTVAGTLDLAGNNDGWHVVTDGTTAYVSRDGGTPEVVAINVSTPSSPSVIGSTVIDGNGRGFSMASGYMYVASTGIELSTVNFTTPSTPNVTNQYNAPGNTDGVGSGVNAGTLYMLRSNSSSPELITFSLGSPGTPSQIGSLNLNGSPTEIAFSGNYAYISSTDNAQELQIVNISNPAAPTLAGSLDLPGNDDANTIYIFDSTLLIGRANGVMRIYSISNPTSPSLVGTFTATASISDITTSSDNSLAFLGVDNNNGEFVVIDISTPASPTQVSEFDIPGNNTLRELSYVQSLDAIVAVSQDNSKEVIILTN